MILLVVKRSPLLLILLQLNWPKDTKECVIAEKLCRKRFKDLSLKTPIQIKSEPVVQFDRPV